MVQEHLGCRHSSEPHFYNQVSDQHKPHREESDGECRRWPRLVQPLANDPLCRHNDRYEHQRPLQQFSNSLTEQRNEKEDSSCSQYESRAKHDMEVDSCRFQAPAWSGQSGRGSVTMVAPSTRELIADCRRQQRWLLSGVISHQLSCAS